MKLPTQSDAAACLLVTAAAAIVYGFVACCIATSANVDGPGQTVSAMSGWLTATKWVGGGLQTVGIAGACSFTSLAAIVGLLVLATFKP